MNQISVNTKCVVIIKNQSPNEKRKKRGERGKTRRRKRLEKKKRNDLLIIGVGNLK